MFEKKDKVVCLIDDSKGVVIGHNSETKQYLVDFGLMGGKCWIKEEDLALELENETRS